MKNEIDTLGRVLTVRPVPAEKPENLLDGDENLPTGNLVRFEGSLRSNLAPGGRQTAPRPDPVTVFLTGYTSTNSRRAMHSSLCVVGEALTGRGVTDPRTIPWHQLRYEHVNALKAKLAAVYASTSANRHMTALRGVLKACWRLGLVDRDVYDRAADVPLLKTSRPEAGRALSEEEVAALFKSCDLGEGVLALRDAAVLALTIGCGLRRAEVCALDVSAYDVKHGSVQVHGKGDKYRVVYLPPKSKERLDKWLERRGMTGYALLCPVSKDGRTIHLSRRLSHQGLTAVLEAICQRAEVAGFTPHDLRRTFITRLLDKGADPLVVSKLAGHANVQTTMKYDRRGEAAKKDAVTLLDF